MQGKFIHNEAQSQFELHVDGHFAFVEYYTQGKKIFLTHTETPHALRNQGVASELIRQTLSYIKGEQLVLVPLCSFVAAYVNQHPHWHSILSEGYQM